MGFRALPAAAGRIAELYEALGGSVGWIGKPHPEIYRAALAIAGDPPARRVICIGDSVEHEFAGARSVGLASALVGSGILAGLGAGELAELFLRHGATPDYLLPRVAWEAA
ncbi:MAG TPA: HAD hydrolase-like protein [Paracoccaceae bacterium]|nr:HAD hydrolase-like protein [Paracoccaceae bacterium]